MREATVGKHTGFKGVLVRCHNKPGSKYTQLVFHTGQGTRYSLSRNMKLVSSLAIGRSYKVRGKLAALGKISYINDPKLIDTSIGFLRRHARMLVLLAVFLPVLGAGGAVYARTQTGLGVLQNTAAPVQSDPKPAEAVETVSATPAAAPEPTPAQPTQEPVAPRPAPAPAKKRAAPAATTSSPAAQPVATTPAASAPSQPPAAPAVETPAAPAPEPTVEQQPPAPEVPAE